MISESDQEVFIFSLKDAQKIQVQERLRDKIMVRLEKGGGLSLCYKDQERAGTLSLIPWSDQVPRVWWSEEDGMDNGSVLFCSV